MKHILILAAIVSLSACQGTEKKTQQTCLVPNIIFETDMGNDVDDALALDMIYKYMDEGKANLLAICSNKDSQHSTEYIHLMNHWYDYPNIPIGKVLNGVPQEHNNQEYIGYVPSMKDENGNDLFSRTPFEFEVIPDAVDLYRQILSKQEDNSVTIISVGFSTNISRLLKSEPDQYSDLNGWDLIKRKVKLLSVMASSLGEDKIADYNVVKDISAAQTVVDSWPTPIVFAPNEAGISVEYPSSSIENDFTWTEYHPLVESYKYYMKMPYNRPTWDLISVLYVVENDPKYFTQSEWGKLTIDDNGYSNFTVQKEGKHAYLTLNKEQAETTRNRFIQLITQSPKSQTK